MMDYFGAIWPDESIRRVASVGLSDDALLSSRSLEVVQAWCGVLQQLRSFAAAWRPPEGFVRPAPQVINDAIKYLGEFRDRFPEHPPLRAAVGPDGEIAIEWQWDGGKEYAEVELTGPNEMEAMYVPASGQAQHRTSQLRLPGGEPDNLMIAGFVLIQHHDSALSADERDNFVLAQ